MQQKCFWCSPHPRKMFQCHAWLKLDGLIPTCNLYRQDLVDCSLSHQVANTIEDRDQRGRDFVDFAVPSMPPKIRSNSKGKLNSHSNRHFSSLSVLFSRNFATLGHLYGNNLFCMSPFLNFFLFHFFHIGAFFVPRASSTTVRCGIKTQIEREKNLIFAAFWLFSTSLARDIQHSYIRKRCARIHAMLFRGMFAVFFYVTS